MKNSKKHTIILLTISGLILQNSIHSSPEYMIPKEYIDNLKDISAKIKLEKDLDQNYLDDYISVTWIKNSLIKQFGQQFVRELFQKTHNYLKTNDDKNILILDRNINELLLKKEQLVFVKQLLNGLISLPIEQIRTIILIELLELNVF